MMNSKVKNIASQVSQIQSTGLKVGSGGIASKTTWT
jgi:hypothetical protein